MNFLFGVVTRITPVSLQKKQTKLCTCEEWILPSKTDNHYRYTTTLIFAASTKPKNIFSFLEDARELLFENIKPLFDILEVLATRENDLS